MKFSQKDSEVYVWNGVAPELALRRTTHLGICAHPDDLEILAMHGILQCFHEEGRAFTGVVVTDGTGSARAHDGAARSAEELRALRRLEQRKAAFVGEYAAQILLDHSSQVVKAEEELCVVEDLVKICSLAQPEVVYTHNLCDQHDTHVAVALRTIAALRELPAELRPTKVIGCEVWRDLDWLPDEYKVRLDVSRLEHLQAALLGVFDSQITGGKRYDLATLGRRKAHATFSESHAVDQSRGLIFGMDLSELLREPTRDPADFALGLIESFSADVRHRLARLRRAL